MAWLESVGNYLAPLLYEGVLAAVIAILTVGLAWGIRPAIEFLLRRMSPTRQGRAATLFQTLLVVGGMTLIVIAVGVNALLWVITVSVAFFVGFRMGRKNLRTDRSTQPVQRISPSALAAQSNRAAEESAAVPANVDAAVVPELAVADATAHLANDAERADTETNELIAPPHSLPAPPIEQPAELMSSGRKLIQHAAAIPLTRRRKLGKRTVRGLR